MMPATRISGACVGCRAKKQKCSGNRSGCAQCLAAGIDCVWPEQRKRGPAKGYIEALEQRLHAAELLLLGLLPHIDDSLLHEATARGAQPVSRAPSECSAGEQGDRRPSRSSPTPVNKKTGVEYWENFTLDTANNVRRWQQNCEEHSYGQTGSLHMQSESQSHLTGVYQTYSGSQERRSSAAAAATIAGMRHSTNTPGTPTSGSSASMMAVTAAPRPSYDSSISPGRSLNITPSPSTAGLAQSAQPRPQPHHHHHHQPQSQTQQQSSPQTQQQMWYQQFQQQQQQQPGAAQHSMSINMNMNVDQNYGQNWSNPQQSSSAMDVDTTALPTSLSHTQQQAQANGHPGGLYQGDFSQNIFW